MTRLSTAQKRALLAAHTGNLIYDGRAFRERWYAWGQPVRDETVNILRRRGLIRVEQETALTRRAVPITGSK